MYLLISVCIADNIIAARVSDNGDILGNPKFQATIKVNQIMYAFILSNL